MLTRRTFVAGAAGLASAAGLLGGSTCSSGWPTGTNFCIPDQPPTSPNVAPKTVPNFMFKEEMPVVRPLLSELVKMPSELRALTQRLAKGYEALVRNNVNNLTNPQGYLLDVWTHRAACRAGVHNTWGFLPWHRGFLYFHERLLRSFVADDFRLPVWDWENIPTIPSPYREGEWIASPLKPRTPGATFRDITDPNALEAWLATPDDFRTFAGYQSATNDKAPQAASGPHAGVHGRAGGFMSDINWSVADPLFFAHHANIDRWWEVWRRRYESTFAQTPEYRDWMKQTFNFYDHVASPPGWYSVSVGQLIHENLGYTYDDGSRPAPVLPEFLAVPAILIDGNRFTLRLNVTQLLAAMQIQNLFALSFPNVRARFQNVSLPVGFQAALNLADHPGYYNLWAIKVGDNSRAVKVGGFGIFSSYDRNMPDMNVFAGTLSLSFGTLVELLALLGPSALFLDFQMVYAAEDPANRNSGLPPHAKPLHVRSLEIRFPA